MKAETKTQHSIRFLYPGTFVGENYSLNVDHRMNVGDILRLEECEGAYAFQPYWREIIIKNDEEFKGPIVERGRYFIDGKLLSLEQVIKRNDPKDKILIANMKCNDWSGIIETNCGWAVPVEGGDRIILTRDYKSAD